MLLLLSCFSHIQLFVILWTVSCQAPLFMRFCRQGYWTGLPFSPPGDLPNPEMEPLSFLFSCIGRQVIYH